MVLGSGHGMLSVKKVSPALPSSRKGKLGFSVLSARGYTAHISHRPLRSLLAGREKKGHIYTAELPLPPWLVIHLDVLGIK